MKPEGFVTPKKPPGLAFLFGFGFFFLSENPEPVYKFDDRGVEKPPNKSRRLPRGLHGGCAG